MMFSELYGAYYNTVAKLIEHAIDGNLTLDLMREIINSNAFSESGWLIEDAIKTERWQLITQDWKTPVTCKPVMPLTELEKSWLKAISLDERVKLFGVDFGFLEGVEPLFTSEDIRIYDQYLDGDNYSDAGYIERFKIILEAVKKGLPLEIVMLNRRGEEILRYVQPKKIEYSPKDDKFRLIARGLRSFETINLQKITSCKIKDGKLRFERRTQKEEPSFVTFELYDERKALERVLLHFAHLKKKTVQTGDNTYLVTIYYDKFDETEILIRILSFGPMIKVTAPDKFVELVKERLIKQLES